MRRMATMAMIASLTLGVSAEMALGGGAVWHFEGYYRPGEIVTSTTSVAWSHNGQLGTPDDGPYLLYLAPMDLEPDTWPEIPDGAMLVGVVEVHAGPYRADDGESYGPHHAIARFEIPDIPPGAYQIMHCNDPCTTTLGDIIGGWDLRVLAGSGGRPVAEIAEEVRASAPYKPLLYRQYPSTTVPPEFVSEPAVHPGLASPTAPASRLQPWPAGDDAAAPSSSTRTAAVEHLAVDDAAGRDASAGSPDRESPGTDVDLVIILVVSLTFGALATLRLARSGSPKPVASQTNTSSSHMSASKEFPQ